jgi:hypothetical protein
MREDDRLEGQSWRSMANDFQDNVELPGSKCPGPMVVGWAFPELNLEFGTQGTKYTQDFIIHNFHCTVDPLAVCHWQYAREKQCDDDSAHDIGV